ncbi:glycosyltransferase WbsX family protein [Shewanella xiamenensis]|uniref:glycosyltransferase WbsX family protein n=1 Tax=Shewanella xiamenensis TaxID=332186 RepID=UPI00313AF8AA
MNSKCKLFAFYFPQFYPTPENSKHWGSGFTDWNNVQEATPQFKGHRQPRVPLLGYYDQSEMSTIIQQVNLAKKYGLSGFSFYHYWFDGELTLEKPVENFLENKELDFKFILTWANETWSKRWVGEDEVIIFNQTHKNCKKTWTNHFNYLLKFWLDDRYEKIGGKPIFNIYNPHLIKNSKEMFDFWNQLAVKNGLPGIHFVAILVSPTFSLSMLNDYNGILDFQPRYSTNNLKVSNSLVGKFIDRFRFLPEPLLNKLTSIRFKFAKVEVINYQDVWDDIINLASDPQLCLNKKRYYCAFVDWDNTARYKNKGKVYSGVSPAVFESNLARLINKAQFDCIIYINAWNEWAEGTYLEPDLENKYSFLEAIKKCNFLP